MKKCQCLYLHTCISGTFYINYSPIMCWRVKFLLNLGWVVFKTCNRVCYQSRIQVSTNLIHVYAEFLVIKMTWSDSFIIIKKIVNHFSQKQLCKLLIYQLVQAPTAILAFLTFKHNHVIMNSNCNMYDVCLF